MLPPQPQQQHLWHSALYWAEKKWDTLVEDCQCQSKRLVKSLIWWFLFRFRQGLMQSYTHFLFDSRQIDNYSKQWKEVYYKSVPVHLPVVYQAIYPCPLWKISYLVHQYWYHNHNNGRTQCINNQALTKLSWSLIAIIYLIHTVLSVDMIKYQRTTHTNPNVTHTIFIGHITNDTKCLDWIDERL